MVAAKGWCCKTHKLVSSGSRQSALTKLCKSAVGSLVLLRKARKLSSVQAMPCTWDGNVMRWTLRRLLLPAPLAQTLSRRKCRTAGSAKDRACWSGVEDAPLIKHGQAPLLRPSPACIGNNLRGSTLLDICRADGRLKGHDLDGLLQCPVLCRILQAPIHVPCSRTFQTRCT